MNTKKRAWTHTLKPKRERYRACIQAIETRGANNGMFGDRHTPKTTAMARSHFTKDALRPWGGDDVSSLSYLNLLVV